MDIAATRAVLHARTAGRRKHEPPLREQVEQVYVLLVGVLVLGAMLVAGGGGLLQGDGCSGSTCLQPAGRPALAAAVGSAGWGMLWRSLVAAGPVAATRAEASWTLSTPADRARLLRPAGLRAAGSALLAGAVLGWLTVTALTASSVGPVQVTSAIGTGAVVGLGTAAVATVAQGSTWRHGPAERAPWLLAMVLAAGCAVVALLRRGVTADVAGPVLAVATPTVLGLLVATAVTAVVCVRAAVRSLPRLRSADLTAAGEAQAGVQGAVLLLDAGSVRPPSGGTGAGVVRSRGGAGTGAWALLHRQLLSLLRDRGVLAGAAGLLLVPALLQLLAGSGPALVVGVLLGARVARSTAGPLLVVAGSGGLSRSLPFSALALTGLLIMVPGVVLLGWAAALVLPLELPVWAAVPVAAAALAALVRSAQPADFADTGALLMTEAGPVPLGIIARVVRGPDVALLATAPLLLQLGPVAATVVPLVLLTVVVRQQARRG